MQEGLADVASAGGIDAVGRLVEDDEVGVGAEGLGEADALEHSFRVLGDFCVGPLGHSDELEEFGGAGAAGLARDFGEGGEEFDDLPAGEISGEAVVFGEIADAGEGGFVADGAVENDAFGAGGTDDGDHDFDEGAFAGAVGAEKAEDFAAMDLHGDALEGVDAAAVYFYYVLEVDGVGGGGHLH